LEEEFVKNSLEVQKANNFTQKEMMFNFKAKERYARTLNKKYWMRKLQFEKEVFNDSIDKPRKIK
jgi:hypothetical protein